MRKEEKKAPQEMTILLVLACLVGVFSFISLGLGMVNAADVDVPDDPEQKAAMDEKRSEYKEALDALEALKRLLAELKTEAAAKSKELSDLQDKLPQLKDEVKRLQLSKEELNRYRDKVTELALLEQKIKELERKKDELSAELKRMNLDESKSARNIQKLRDEIKEITNRIKDIIKKMEQLERQKRTVNIGQLWGKHSDKRPQFVECRGDGVVLQPQRISVSLSELETLSERAIDASDCVVFLVRPSGFESFEKARAVIERKKIKIGYEPVDADWVIEYGKEGA